MTRELRREFSLRDLVLFHITAVITVRWISYAAARGPSSLSLWALAFFLFFLPIAYTVIDFTRKMPEQGGLYQWTKTTLGPFHGFICAWCYIVNNLFYFPSLLVAVAGYAAFSLVGDDQTLQSSKWFVGGFSLGAIWLILGLNLIGLKFGKWVNNIGGLSIWLPCTLLIVFGFLRFFLHDSATNFASAKLFPDFGILDTWTAWSLICFAFTGLELASTMSGEAKDPEKNIPRSIYLAGFFITMIYIMGTVAVLFMVSSDKINLVTGIMQAISVILSNAGLSFLTPTVAVLLTLGGLGTFGAWLAGAARMPYSVGVDRYLPPVLAKIHPRWGTPYVSLLVLGVISSLIVLMSLAGATVEKAYLFLANACLIIYFIPFVYLFLSHLLMNWKTERRSLALILALAGLFSTTVAIILAVLPQPGEEHPWRYFLSILVGSFGFVLVSLIFYYGSKRKSLPGSSPL
jgi:amino acid transporter